MIPARHGTATFVPAGQTIKIINTSGTQVIDTWAFALPKPEAKKGQAPQIVQEGQEQKKDDAKEQKLKATPAKKQKNGMSLPTQEEAEKVTEQGLQAGDEVGKDAKDATPQKSSWGSYVPSVGWPTLRSGPKDAKQQAEQKQDSRTWGSYFPSGKGFSNYVPKSAGDTVSQFASTVRIPLTKWSASS